MIEDVRSEGSFKTLRPGCGGERNGEEERESEVVIEENELLVAPKEIWIIPSPIWVQDERIKRNNLTGCLAEGLWNGFTYGPRMITP